MIMIFNIPVIRSPARHRQCLHDNWKLDNTLRQESTKKGSHLRGLWSCIAWLATVLALAVPATAAPLHHIVAVGDLHGDFSAWRDIVRSASLVDAKGHWTGGDTILIQAGDAVDRGPNSLEIIEDLMRLQKEAARAHGQVIAMAG